MSSTQGFRKRWPDQTKTFFGNVCSPPLKSQEKNCPFSHGFSGTRERWSLIPQHQGTIYGWSSGGLSLQPIQQHWDLRPVRQDLLHFASFTPGGVGRVQPKAELSLLPCISEIESDGTNQNPHPHFSCPVMST